jgi:HD-GYP domain-containing protein (c-di-GMP phosphodiesterase class II)
MKRLVVLLTVGLCVGSWATEVTPAMPADAVASSPLDAQRNAERERLTRARQALENQYKQDMKQCYQHFDVTSCRLNARDRRIEANNLLRKDELRFNAQERQIQAEDARRSLAERTSEAERKRSEAERAAAIAASKERSDANAQKQIDHALQGSKRGDYEQKQREAAQHREDVARKLRERNKEPAAPLPVPGR